MLQIIFNITEAAITSLGRNATLTGRDQLWSDVLQMNPNILIGTGFESFWLGKRLEILWEKYWWQPNQSHNGYIETYINLGWLGLFFLSTTIISIFRNIQNRLLYSFILRGPEISHFYFERFCMGFLISLLIYNITEAVFKSTHFLFLIFFIIAIKYPQVKPETGE
jgi:O-antigen ligase